MADSGWLWKFILIFSGKIKMVGSRHIVGSFEFLNMFGGWINFKNSEPISSSPNNVHSQTFNKQFEFCCKLILQPIWIQVLLFHEYIGCGAPESKSTLMRSVCNFTYNKLEIGFWSASTKSAFQCPPGSPPIRGANCTSWPMWGGDLGGLPHSRGDFHPGAGRGCRCAVVVVCLYVSGPTSPTRVDKTWQNLRRLHLALSGTHISETGPIGCDVGGRTIEEVALSDPKWWRRPEVAANCLAPCRPFWLKFYVVARVWLQTTWIFLGCVEVRGHRSWKTDNFRCFCPGSLTTWPIAQPPVGRSSRNFTCWTG